MPQVLNRSKNASANINGINFTKTAKGMLSDDITQDQADYFLKMPNYVAVKTAPSAPVAPKTPATPPSDPAAAADAAAAEAERQAAETAAAAAAAKQNQQA